NCPLPSHVYSFSLHDALPISELLDWLATELVEQHWSLKAMHRLIVTSATYRQSSTVSPGLVQRDPFNRLLGRGPRFRMEAEMLRDRKSTRLNSSHLGISYAVF